MDKKYENSEIELLFKGIDLSAISEVISKGLYNDFVKSLNERISLWIVGDSNEK